MKVLIVVASKHGSTREIAEAIAIELRVAGIDTDLRDMQVVKDIYPYDAVIIGSAVYEGSWMPEAKNFASIFRKYLLTMPVWIFSSGPLGMDKPLPHTEPEKLVTFMDGMPVREHKVFVGKLDRDKLGLVERALTCIVSAPEGDFRDWAAILTWARKIAEALNAYSVAPTTPIPAPSPA